ncbi:hypothetical protein [Streptomyces sp. CC224B]|uniref:hypothetical protein n=1 Tax=Streptomyces sp. CC224B TaxID=3044571 RepID=UPI0024A9B796|nr:hypothetical protein [Streptomyces sp. CC224B]
MTHATPVVLVIGNTSTADTLSDLTALAFDAADRLRLHAVVAVGMEHNVDDYAGVVLDPSWLDSTSAAVLGAEAMERDMCVMTPEELHATFEPTRACTHCGAVRPSARPRLIGGTWTPSVCGGCAQASAVHRSLAHAA